MHLLIHKHYEPKAFTPLIAFKYQNRGHYFYPLLVSMSEAFSISFIL